MTELEILAELKQAYLNLEDIIENQMQQLTKEQIKELKIAMEILAKQYNTTYEYVKTLEDVNLEYQRGLFVAPHIFYDYLTTEEDFTEYIPYTNLDNEEKWWEDYDFLS